MKQDTHTLIETIQEIKEDTDRYKKCLDMLREYPNMIQNFKSDSVEFIILDSNEVDMIFDVAFAFYFALYIEKKQEEEARGVSNIANMVMSGAMGIVSSIIIVANPLIGGIISGITTAMQGLITLIQTKGRKYPSRINDLPKVISMFIKWAKISPKNQNIIMDGTYHYIEMQKEEYNDFVKEYEAGYVELDSVLLHLIAFNLLPQYKEMVKKAMKSGGEQTYAQIPDIYPQGSGKDNTNSCLSLRADL